LQWLDKAAAGVWGGKHGNFFWVRKGQTEKQPIAWILGIIGVVRSANKAPKVGCCGRPSLQGIPGECPHPLLFFCLARPLFFGADQV
jgi:hypothetical protein